MVPTRQQANQNDEDLSESQGQKRKRNRVSLHLPDSQIEGAMRR